MAHDGLTVSWASMLVMFRIATLVPVFALLADFAVRVR
jgi:hypothetical protein